MKLAFDLHGVIMYLMPVMAKYYREEVGFELDTENDRFCFHHPEWYDPRRFGVDIARAIKTMAVPYAKPVRGSIQALNEWKARGNKITIITASAPSTMEANDKWLKKYYDRDGDFEIHRVSHQEGKLETIKELGVTHFVDDRFKTCNELADHLEYAYLMDAACNRGRKTKANVIRVSSLRQVIKHIDEHK